MNKVIFLISTLSTGGGERVASELSFDLQNKADVTIALFRNEISYPYKGKIFLLGDKDFKNIFFKIYNIFFILLKFRDFVKKEKPDYVLSFGHLPNLVNIFSGARAVVRVDNFYSLSCRGFTGKIYKILVKLFFNKAKFVVAVSRESARDLIENFKIKKEKIKIIYNPLNVEEIEKLSKVDLEEEYKYIFKNNVIINIGQMGKQKNQEILIRSFKEVKNKVKNSKLVILGKGKLESHLKEVVKDLGIEKDVYFLGWQKNPFKFLANSKVFALSSLWEGLPYVILESMVCGLPVVSFDCMSGPREILAPNTNYNKKTKDIEYSDFGVLVKPEDPEKLAKAIIKILLDKKLLQKIKNASLSRVADFGSKSIVKEWEFLYT